MKFPSQDIARFTLAQKSDPYGTVEYRAILRSQSADKVLVCSHCGFTATQDQIHQFHNTNDPSVGASKINMDVLAEGWGLFRSLPLDHNPWNQDAKNFERVCEPCFHAGHAVMPGFDPVGKYGLVNVMSQSEIIMAWRALMLGSNSGKMRAAQSKEAIRSLIASAELEFIRELVGTGGAALRITNVDMTYWAAYAKSEIHEVAPKIIPDLRFLPSVEPSAYGLHLHYCQRFAPLFPPDAVSDLASASGQSTRMDPTLERPATT